MPAEFWERYVRWLDGKGMEAEADAALQRASNIFCRTRPELFLFAARHEERRGHLDLARAHLRHVLDSMAPGLLAAVAASANLERRQVRTQGLGWCLSGDGLVSVRRRFGVCQATAYSGTASWTRGMPMVRVLSKQMHDSCCCLLLFVCS